MSMVTGLIGGILGSGAATKAGNIMASAYNQAPETVWNAVNAVNPSIIKGAMGAGANVTGAGQIGGKLATGAAERLANILQPYMTAGAGAAAQLPGAAQPFTADKMAEYSPEYQFVLNQGEQAANRAAAAQGVSGAGGTLKALNQYAQNYAGTQFTNASNLYNQNFNRLATLANMGMGAGATAGQAGIQAGEYAGNLGYGAAQYAGNMNMQAGELAASNTLGAANFQANSAINAAKAQAQGVLGSTAAWNQMLGGIGQTANAIGAAGFGPNGWSFSNIGPNLGTAYGGPGAWGTGGGVSDVSGGPWGDIGTNSWDAGYGNYSPGMGLPTSPGAAPSVGYVPPVPTNPTFGSNPWQINPGS